MALFFAVKLFTVYSSFTQRLGFAANKMATAGKGVFRFPDVLLSNRRFESSLERRYGASRIPIVDI